MSLFDRFTNPVWHLASTLDVERQRVAALMIVGYAYCREMIRENLVAPINQINIDHPVHVDSESIREKLIDEALVGLLRSCDAPQNDLDGNIPDRIVQNLAGAWGVFAMVDRNHHLKLAGPETLEKSGYSSDSDEARTQVLVKWSEILSVSQPNFVAEANRRWFYKEWDGLSAVMISSVLKGFSRVPDDVTFKKARSIAAGIPDYRLPAARYAVEKLASASLSPAGLVSSGGNSTAGAQHQPMPPKQRDEQGVVPRQRKYGVEEQPDGKAAIKLAPDAGPLDFIRAMVVMMQPRLVAGDAEVCKRWVSAVTGTTAPGSQWNAVQVDALVHGFERFYWDGEGNNAWLTELIRKEYLDVKGSPIDVNLTDEVRTVFRMWTTKR